MHDWKYDRVESAERGENPMVMARMKSGFAVVGDTQFLPGYSVLLAAPKVESLNELSLEERTQFLLAHVFPRYDYEHPEYFKQSPFNYPREKWYAPQYRYNDAQHGDLRTRITELLQRYMRQASALP